MFAANILLVGSQPEVIAALRKAGIKIILVYPERSLKSEYIERFKQRNDTETFIELIANSWDEYLNYLEKQNDFGHIVLGQGQYLSDVLSL